MAIEIMGYWVDVDGNGPASDVPCLTTVHPASSHGIPVLVVDGIAYGPDDIITPYPHPARDEFPAIFGDLAWPAEPERPRYGRELVLEPIYGAGGSIADALRNPMIAAYLSSSAVAAR